MPASTHSVAFTLAAWPTCAESVRWLFPDDRISRLAQIRKRGFRDTDRGDSGDAGASLGLRLWLSRDKVVMGTMWSLSRGP